MTRKAAKKYRKKIEEMAAACLDDCSMLDYCVLCQQLREGIDYEVGDRVSYEGVIYKCLQNHKSHAVWSPSGGAVSLWARVINQTPTGEIPEWQQPDSTNTYSKGDKVRYNGKVYESLIDGNAWSPDGYPAGWKEIEE